MSIVAEKFDLAALNQMFETSAADQIVQWASIQFGDGLVMSSSFGDQAAVLLHMASRVIPDIKVIFVDTGYLFPETHGYMEQLRLKLKLNVWTYRTRNDPFAYLHKAGEENPTWRKDIPACCAVNKNEPFERAMKELAPRAWLRGVRRQQTSVRQGEQFIEWYARYNCHAVSPLLNWGSREIHEYFKKFDLPFHPLRDKGFESIGCNPLSCSSPVGAGEDPRSGRWQGTDKVECGINLKNSLDSANL